MKKINKKYLIIGILVFVFVCLVSLGIYFSNKKENTNNNDDVKLVIKKDVSVEVMSELLNAKDFFDRDVNSNAKILYYLDDEEIDFNLKYDKVGTYKVVINIDDIKYDTTLNVVDTTKPDLKLKSVTIVFGKKYEITDFVDNCTDNSGEECILSYKEDKIYDKVGTYDIVIIAKDSSGNELEETTKLEILKKQTSNTKNNNNRNTHNEVDGTNFNAKTSDMLPEAIENMSIYQNEVNDVVKYTNEFRTEAGKEPLKLDETLTKAAMVRAIEMAYSNKFSHERPDGNMCYYIMRDFGQDIYGVGENIASRQRNAKEVSYAWKGSQGHYENMISSSFTRIGIGVIKFYGTYYWVQLFQY